MNVPQYIHTVLQQYGEVINIIIQPRSPIKLIYFATKMRLFLQNKHSGEDDQLQLDQHQTWLDRHMQRSRTKKKKVVEDSVREQKETVKRLGVGLGGREKKDEEQEKKQGGEIPGLCAPDEFESM